MNKKAKFWNKIAKKYASRPVDDESAYHKKLEKTQEFFTPESEVLEIGCGTGTTSLHHAPYVKHIRAVDISENMLAIARERLESSVHNNVTFEQADIDDLSVDDQSMDAVLTLSLLHLLEDKEAAIAKIHRILKAGGVFVSSTVCLDNMKFLKYILAIGHFFGLLPLVRFFSRDQLLQSIKNAGFTIEFEWQPKKNAAVFVIARKV